MEPTATTRTASPARVEDADVPPELGAARPARSQTDENGRVTTTSHGPHRRGDSGRVLVLNASYEPLNVCSVRRAVVLILKEKAELLEQGERVLHAESVTFPHPVVIRLVTYVRVPRDRAKRRITRRAVFARDSWTCQYCGTTSHLTVDHVIPRSRGGPSDWENIVTSCAPCNRRKGNRTPVEAGFQTRRKPKAPSPTIFIRVAAPVVPAAWQQYLLA
jgi:5-methylcytosine-specific restriction endonuclease McrA